VNVVDKSHKNTGQQLFVRRVVATWGRFMLLNECDVGHITGKVEATEHGLPFGQNDTQVSRFIRGVLKFIGTLAMPSFHCEGSLNGQG
jgi:hypothetical protein